MKQSQCKKNIFDKITLMTIIMAYAHECVSSIKTISCLGYRLWYYKWCQDYCYRHPEDI